MGKVDKNRLLEAFILSDSPTEIARQTGVSRKTVYNYMAKPEFAKNVREYRRKSIEKAVMRFEMHACHNIEKLQEVIDNADSDYTRLMAIQTYFSTLPKLQALSSDASNPLIDEAFAILSQVHSVIQ